MNMQSLPFASMIVPEKTLGFRECAGIVKIAEATHTKIYLTRGKLIGSSDSLLSLVRLATKKDAPISITITGDDTKGAFDGIRELLKAEE